MTGSLEKSTKSKDLTEYFKILGSTSGNSCVKLAMIIFNKLKENKNIKEIKHPFLEYMFNV
jgi:hypothetical protein